MMEPIFLAGILCAMATGFILTLFALSWFEYDRKYYSLLLLAALTAWLAFLCFLAI